MTTERRIIGLNQARRPTRKRLNGARMCNGPSSKRKGMSNLYLSSKRQEFPQRPRQCGVGFHLFDALKHHDAAAPPQVGSCNRNDEMRSRDRPLADRGTGASAPPADLCLARQSSASIRDCAMWVQGSLDQSRHRAPHPESAQAGMHAPSGVGASCPQGPPASAP